jgi:hypothetical protein
VVHDFGSTIEGNKSKDSDLSIEKMQGVGLNAACMALLPGEHIGRTSRCCTMPLMSSFFISEIKKLVRPDLYVRRSSVVREYMGRFAIPRGWNIQSGPPEETNE